MVRKRSVWILDGTLRLRCPRYRQAIVSGLMLLLSAAALAAQDRDPAFSVASIKPAQNNGCPCRLDLLPGGILRGTHVTLEQLLLMAYRRPAGNLRPDLIADAPDWARVEKFDIEAQAGANADTGQIALMLQQLLEERFKLGATWESRARDVYILRRKRSDSVGPDLRQNTTAACASARTAGQPLSQTHSTGGRLWFGRACATPDDLASNLSSLLKTEVFDETGLTGLWDYVATYPDDAAAAPTGPNDLSLIPLALERNLGLTLVQQRRAIQMLVVKSVAPLTPN